MVKKKDYKERISIPVICADKSSVDGARIFNPNNWLSKSKGIIQSCWTEYSVLHHCVEQISCMCNGAEQLCQKQIKDIQNQWDKKKFDLKKIIIYCQQPDLHIRIEAFFSEVKILLDLLVQLLSSENIIVVDIDGFHRVNDIYGGKVLNALENNALKDRKETADKIKKIIIKHKKLWIDQAINARDQLIHPPKGIHQIMFHLEFSESAANLVCIKVNPPKIDSSPIDLYSKRIIKNISNFSSCFLKLIMR